MRVVQIELESLESRCALTHKDGQDVELSDRGYRRTERSQ